MRGRLGRPAVPRLPDADLQRTLHGWTGVWSPEVVLDLGLPDLGLPDLGDQTPGHQD